MKKPVRWGLIGCGAVTESKSGPAYQKVDGFHLSAVMRRDSEKGKDFARRHGVERFIADADDLINSKNIDAVYIATPPDSHKYYALKVAKAGKPCCIEKPLAPGYQECLEICRAFEAKGVPLFVAYYRRSLPRFNEIKHVLDNGTIGIVRHLTWNLSRPVSQHDLSGNYNWRTDKNIAYGGYFDDLASHGLDLFAYLLGDFDEVKGVSLNQQGIYSSQDAVAACWVHTTGVTGNGSWNFDCSSRQDDVMIHGSEGVIKFSVFDDQPVFISGVNGEQEIFIENPENVQLSHVQNIANQLFNDDPHPSIGWSASHTGWAIDKILGRIGS
jgi:1,5-anhydro-D-fructose reductase (1,5-anhydro-D-mannitol-forming)